MKFKIFITALVMLSSAIANIAFAAGLEDKTIILKSNERFDLVQASTVTFKFQPLSEDARKLEITNDATALGVAYLGQVKLKKNNTALSALRSIADQIGESLDIRFGVIADSNTSEALKANELLLLYHPSVTITLALARPDENSDYEVICTYALKNLIKIDTSPQAVIPPPADSQQVAPTATSQQPSSSNDIAPAKNMPEETAN